MKKMELTMDDLDQVAGGVCVTKTGVEYYKADDKFIYYRQQGKEHKVGIKDMQCTLGRSCKEMKAFIEKINDDKTYG
jgi:hypothetical protein